MPSLTKVQSGFMEAQDALPLNPGTASAPALKFSDHSGTGMFSPNTGEIAFSTSNHSQAVTIKTDGNFGIGTNNPTASLQINSATPKIILRDDDNGADISVASIGGAAVYSAASDIIFQTVNTTERLRINSLGKIIQTNFSGIGFHMSGSGDPTLQISDTDGTNQYVMLAHNGGDSYIVTRNNTSHGGFRVYSQNGSETLTRLRIDSGGRIGIKNTSPSSQYFNNLVIGDNSSGDWGMTIRTNSSNKGVIAFSDTDSADANRYDGYIAYHHNDQSMRFHTGGANERLRISSAGKVRVGSGNAAYNLEVQTTGFVETMVGSTNAGGAGIILDGDSNGDGAGGDYAQIFHNTDGTLNFRSRNPNGGTDTIFLSNTTETLRITSAGLVQIDTPGVSAGNGASAKLQVDSSSQYDGLLLGGGASYGTISTGANAALIYTSNASPANLGGGFKATHQWWSGSAGGGGPNERMALSTGGTLYMQGNAPINTDHHGAIVSYVPASGTYMYKSIEIGTNAASGADTGSQIVSRAKNASRLPFCLLGSWDNNSSMTVYYGGGWGNASRPATRHLWYTTSYMDTAASGNVRMELHADGNLSIGNFVPVDTRNTGGIHIQNSRGISFQSLSTTADSRNWRIRNDDMAWGALDISVGSSNSDWGTTANDVITRFSNDGVDVRGHLGVVKGSSAIKLSEYSNGAVIWMDGANGDMTGGDYFNIMANNNQQLSFGYAGTENIKMNTSGQLYLANYPTTHTVASGSHLKLRAGAGAWGISLGMRASQNDYAYFGFTDMNGTEQIGDIFMQRTGTSAGHMVFSTNNGNTGSTNRLKIDKSGRISISPTASFNSASTNIALSIVNNGGTGGYPGINLTSVATGGNTNSATGMSIVVSDVNWNLYSNSGNVHGLGILTGNSANSGNVAQYVRSDKKIVMGPESYARLNTCTRANAAVMVAGGGLSIGPKSNHSDGSSGGRYVKGWYITTYNTSNTYLHLKTSLWAGGSPNGNTQYIMGGFVIEGYRYSSGAACSTERIMFHNWGGNYPGYDRSHVGNWNPGNTVYTSSDGYVVLRLSNGSYYGYVIDLIQHAWYPTQDITVTSATYSNSNI